MGPAHAVASHFGRPSNLLTSFCENLRGAEKVLLGALAYALLVSAVFPLPLRQRLLLSGLNLTVTGAIMLLSASPRSSGWLAALRDWFPAVVILVAYRESGFFFKPDPTHHLDFLFVQWDRLLLENMWVKSLLTVTAPWLQRYLELSYLLCYPLVPLGFAALFMAPSVGVTLASPIAGGANPAPTRRRDGAALDFFWTTVLLATLTCYAVYPFFPLTPPRLLFHDLPGPAVEPLLRKANFWILDRYGVQACIFPSGHVAAVTAVALAVRAYLPRLGLLFLLAAGSVAVATVYGRYHYGADALAGALVGVLAFLISRRIHS